MRFVANKRSLPRSFARHPHAKGLVGECDVHPRPRGRLAAKVLVFDSQRSLRSFWRKAFGPDISRHCLGVVNAIAEERWKPGKTPAEDGPHRIIGDARYFCVVGLCLGNLHAEVVVHEAVHAGYCYEKRVKRNMFGAAVGDFDEERIAYPVGVIAAGINDYLHAKGLIDRQPVRSRRR